MDWLAYLIIGMQLWIRLRMFKGKTIRTLIVVEAPGRPLSLEEAQVKLADTGATVLPGFTVTP